MVTDSRSTPAQRSQIVKSVNSPKARLNCNGWHFLCFRPFNRLFQQKFRRQLDQISWPRRIQEGVYRNLSGSTVTSLLWIFSHLLFHYSPTFEFLKTWLYQRISLPGQWQYSTPYILHLWRPGYRINIKAATENFLCFSNLPLVLHKDKSYSNSSLCEIHFQTVK